MMTSRPIFASTAKSRESQSLPRAPPSWLYITTFMIAIVMYWFVWLDNWLYVGPYNYQKESSVPIMTRCV